MQHKISIEESVDQFEREGRREKNKIGTDETIRCYLEQNKYNRQLFTRNDKQKRERKSSLVGTQIVFIAE